MKEELIKIVNVDKVGLNEGINVGNMGIEEKVLERRNVLVLKEGKQYVCN